MAYNLNLEELSDVRSALAIFPLLKGFDHWSMEPLTKRIKVILLKINQQEFTQLEQEEITDIRRVMIYIMQSADRIEAIYNKLTDHDI